VDGVADPDADGGDSEVAGSNRPSTSAVWDDFEKLFKKVPGKKPHQVCCYLQTLQEMILCLFC